MPLRLALAAAGFRAAPGAPSGQRPAVFSRPLSGPLPEVPVWVTSTTASEAGSRASEP
jgi:hypothetical protein